MKCKSRRSIKAIKQVLGLIEAYWNVNGEEQGLTESEAAGLIEAYWNVNDVYAASKEDASLRFNRSILKCKCYYSCSRKVFEPWV